MEPDQTDNVRHETAPRTVHERTPDSATWDVRENAEVELLGDQESIDEVDVVDEMWAPGQPSPGMPADEVLHIRTFADGERPADELELDDMTEDRLALAADELFEGEAE